ncbi:hypothetical protein B9Z55_016528 [Caenorhabditis nigoni]|uniref:Uncharacterized protein n=2 Tax=Caenorhabditis nigoni TaxID=1611254 RepID=A0A2G5T5X8_9PELO|nr:hypothetical protein B9Z55_016528 [Caenorhabditis nigoni]
MALKLLLVLLLLFTEVENSPECDKRDLRCQVLKHKTNGHLIPMDKEEFKLFIEDEKRKYDVILCAGTYQCQHLGRISMAAYHQGSPIDAFFVEFRDFKKEGIYLYKTTSISGKGTVSQLASASVETLVVDIQEHYKVEIYVLTFAIFLIQTFVSIIVGISFVVVCNWPVPVHNLGNGEDRVPNGRAARAFFMVLLCNFALATILNRQFSPKGYVELIVLSVLGTGTNAFIGALHTFFYNQQSKNGVPRLKIIDTIFQVLAAVFGFLFVVFYARFSNDEYYFICVLIYITFVSHPSDAILAKTGLIGFTNFCAAAFAVAVQCILSSLGFSEQLFSCLPAMLIFIGINAVLSYFFSWAFVGGKHIRFSRNDVVFLAEIQFENLYGVFFLTNVRHENDERAHHEREIE